MATSCATCGSIGPPGARFCPRCGSVLPLACPACGRDQPADAAFCSACGAALLPGVPRAGATPADSERKVVTLLFADLAGSTALADRLDPEDVRELQRSLFELVGTEVERYGGVTEKFVGDAVLAVFGVPHAHEDDPERAVRAGLAIHAAAAAVAPGWEERYGVPLALRVGVNTGEVVASREAAARGELVVSGDAVNVAARLQQAAHPGQVVVGERTRRASDGAVVYGEQRPLPAKGKPDGVAGSLALALRRDGGRRTRLAAPLIGRDDELALLGSLARRVTRDARPQLVTLFGEAGVGKSRLVDEFTRALAGATVLRGRCLPYGEAVVTRPLAEIAKAHAGIVENEPAASARQKLRADLGTLLGPEEAAQAFDVLAAAMGVGPDDGRLAGLAAEDVRRIVATAWSRYLRGLGGLGLAVVIIEDVHWAAPPLLDLLEQLTATLTTGAVLLICPARPELLDARPHWGGGRRNATALTLAPLDATDSGRLVAALLGTDVTPEVADRVGERAEGNPFYTEEIVRMLVEQGGLRREGDGWRATPRLAGLAIPDSVNGVIAARIDLLGAAERQALRECAVVGRTFWAEPVAANEAVLERLAARELVVEHQGTTMTGFRQYGFKHALTRDVAYAALPRAERRRLHELVARWIEGVAPDRPSETVELVAHHLHHSIACGAEDADLLRWAVRVLRRAGEEALMRGAIEAARSHLEEALRLAEDEAERARAERALGEVEILQPQRPSPAPLLESARDRFGALGDDVGLAEALAWLSRAYWLDARTADAVAAADAAVEALSGRPEDRMLARALTRRSQLHMLMGMPEAVASATEALEVARRVGDGFAEASSMINLASAWGFDGGADASHLHLEAIPLALESGAYEEVLRALVNYVWTTALAQTLPDLEAVVAREVARIGGGAETGIQRYLDLTMLRFVAFPRGDFDVVAAALRRAPQDTGTGGIVWLELDARLALVRGAPDAAERVAAALDLAGPTGEAQRITPARILAAHRAALTGDRDAVMSHVEAARSSQRGRRAHPFVEDLAREGPRALLRAGAAGAVESLAHELRPELGAALPSRGGEAAAATLDGLSLVARARAREAIARLERARDLHAASGALYEGARAELDLAAALAEAGEEGASTDARARADAVLRPRDVVAPV